MSVDMTGIEVMKIEMIDRGRDRGTRDSYSPGVGVFSNLKAKF